MNENIEHVQDVKLPDVEKFEKVREELGLSRRELSRKSGLDKEVIRRIERRKNVHTDNYIAYIEQIKQEVKVSVVRGEI